MDVKKEEMIKHEAQYKNIGIQCDDLTCEVCKLSEEEQDYEWKRHQLKEKIPGEIVDEILEKQKQFKDAMWQYVIDHSKIQPNGYLGIQFYCKNRKDFFDRVKAREEGFFRYEALTKEYKVQSLQDKLRKYEHLKSCHRIALKHNIFIRNLAKLYEKLIIDKL